ncbi:MAG: DUF4113 domain-containing protein [Comamonadaceae bacterium]
MALCPMSEGGRAWSMKQERRTPEYTSCWADMPVARAEGR